MKRRGLATLVLVVLSVSGCATSSHILLGEPRLRIDPNLVRLYSAAPENSQEIAILSVESSGWTEQGEKDLAISKLKKEAASLGANGVLILNLGTDTGGVVGSVNPQTGAIFAGASTYTTLRGTAIFVPKSTESPGEVKTSEPAN